MKIKSMKWKVHAILKNLELDFMNKETGQPYETIIFAGENGTGKTTIFELIYSYFTSAFFRGFGPSDLFDTVEYVAKGQHVRSSPANASEGHSYEIVSDSHGLIGFTSLPSQSGSAFANVAIALTQHR